MITLALIPARSGSKGVPHKNIRLLGGHPLLAWSIAAAKLATCVDRVIVTTDSEEYASIARRYGAEVPFLRPTELAGCSSPDRDFMIHALMWLQKHEMVMPDLLVHLRPTSPLRDPGIIDQAIRAFMEDPGADSLRSGHEASESPAKWFRLEGKTFVGLMGNEWLNLPRQCCPKGYVANGYIDIVRPKHVISGGDFYFPCMKAFITPVAYEVDTLEDFALLEFQVQKGHVLFQWLENAVNKVKAEYE